MTDSPRLNKAQRVAKRKLSNEAQSFLKEFFSTYGGDFNAYNKLAAKYPALVSLEVLDYLKASPSYVKAYPEVFGENPSLESQYATQAVTPSIEESEDTVNQIEQSDPSNTETTPMPEDTPVTPEESPQEASIYEDNTIPKLKDAIDRGTTSKPYLRADDKLLNDIATSIIRGDYGNGTERVNNLYKAGLSQDDINRAQKMVNEHLRSNRPIVTKSVKPVTVEQPQEVTAAKAMVNAISPEPIRAKNTGYAQPPLNHATDAIWDRVRKAGLSSPEQAIRSGVFSPEEVRYITENDLWRYRQ